jgi:hypothetical protein
MNHKFKPYYLGKAVKKDGKVVLSSEAAKVRYADFVKAIPDFTECHLYLETVSGYISNAELKKIHAMIREIANESGHSFNEIKDLVKYKSGLITELGKESFSELKSEEIESVFVSLYDMGMFLNINF